MIKYVFFDFNGTILDDVDLCLNLLNKLLTLQNKKKLDIIEYRNVFTFPIKKYYELAGIDFNLNSFEELSEIFINDYQEASYHCAIYPHLREVLAKLTKLNIKKVVLSASQIDNLTKQLEILKLKTEFDNVLGLDNIYATSKILVASDFINNNKINPKEVLLVGDTTHDFEVANKLGFKIILFSGGHQSITVLSKTNAPIISDLSEVLNFID